MPRPYANPDEHLHDELWRLWLELEESLRKRWERDRIEVAPEMERLLARARAEHAGGDPAAAPPTAAEVHRARLDHVASLETRIESSLVASQPLPLLELCRRLRLDPTQRELIIWVLALDLDPRLLVPLEALELSAVSGHVTPRALASLLAPEPSRRARILAELSPGSPLVDLELVRAEEPAAPIRAAPRIFRFLSAIEDLDPDLRGAAELLAPPRCEGVFPPELPRAVADLLDSADPVLLRLDGTPGVGRRLLMRTAAARRGRKVLCIQADQVGPESPAGALAREALLCEAIPLVEGEGSRLIADLGSLYRGPIAWAPRSGEESQAPASARPLVTVGVPFPGPEERAAILRQASPDLSPAEAERLGAAFEVSGATLTSAARAAEVLGRTDAASLEEILARRTGHRGRLMRP